jgi:putative MATE family efflux protein
MIRHMPERGRSPVHAVWRLGIPVATQSLLSSMLAFVDTMMVTSLGASALAGVGIAGRMLFVVSMVLSGLAGGTGILVAQYAGAGRTEEIKGKVAAALRLGVLLTMPLAAASLFFGSRLGALLAPDPDVAAASATFLTYGAAYAPATAISMTLAATLRSLGNTRTPLWSGASSLALNTLLNYVFVLGHFGAPSYGIAAAALATTAARLIEISSLAFALRRHLAIRTHWGDAALLVRTTLPLVVKELCWAGGLFAAGLIVSRMGKVPLAALNLVTPVEGILVSIFTGCGAATGILLGHALGRKEFDHAYLTAERLRQAIPKAGMAAGVAGAVLVELLRQLGWLRGVIDPQLHDIALDSLAVMLLFIGARIHNMMVSMGILRSGNDVKWLMAVDLCSMWLVNVPLVAAAALWLKAPLPAVVAVMMCEEVLKVGIFRSRVRSRRWLNSVVAPAASVSA